MEVTTGAIRGSYEELVDAAEDIGDILSAAATNLLDLTRAVERWLVDQLENIEIALARELDTYGGERRASRRWVGAASGNGVPHER